MGGTAANAEPTAILQRENRSLIPATGGFHLGHTAQRKTNGYRATAAQHFMEHAELSASDQSEDDDSNHSSAALQAIPAVNSGAGAGHAPRKTVLPKRLQTCYNYATGKPCDGACGRSHGVQDCIDFLTEQATNNAAQLKLFRARLSGDVRLQATGSLA